MAPGDRAREHPGRAVRPSLLEQVRGRLGTRHVAHEVQEDDEPHRQGCVGKAPREKLTRAQGSGAGGLLLAIEVSQEEALAEGTAAGPITARR